ncbi:hypothetical protein SteCoe_3334 [Stentor coeruleus]|uniref:Non-haem dioxygenase N-terminal domain-containing protein n=1 Tax=Stentor coeruleus TaxID=5963 RepID=A0A1R2CX95_9CILI|nr:hypothetical protein SteCoe_3334 [Stentor coeruleus]
MLRKVTKRFLSYKEPISLKYCDLHSPRNLSNELFEAFGKDGLGLLSISGIPYYRSQRQKLLSLSYELSHLSVLDKAKIENPESGFNIGWKESSSQYPCGTFTANPIDDYNQDAFYQNLWPLQSLPSLRPTFRELSTTIMKTVFLLAMHIDKYMELLFPYSNSQSFEGLLCDSHNHIGSLNHSLSYNQGREDNDFNWKNYSGLLTAYTCPLFINTVTASPLPFEFFDYETGIIVKDANNESVHIKINNDMLIIQVGFVSQILSGGVFRPKPTTVYHDEKFAGTGRSEFRMLLNPNDDCQLQCPDEVNAFTSNVTENEVKEYWKSGATFASIASLIN